MDDDPKCKAHFPPWRGLLCLYGFFHGVMGSHTVCRMESSLIILPSALICMESIRRGIFSSGGGKAGMMLSPIFFWPEVRRARG